jgi:hypothetical protein
MRSLVHVPAKMERMGDDVSSLFALCSSVLLAAFVLLVRKGTCEGRGTPAEAIVVVLAVNAILHGISGGIIYFPHYPVGVVSVLAFMAA